MQYRPSFLSTATGARVRFGVDARGAVAEEVARIGARRALFLSTPEQAEACRSFADACAARSAGLYRGARMHTPVDVTEDALARVREAGVDCLVAVGGGSTTGLGKALAYRTDLPQIVAPTTYAGSEATPILGQTERGRKTTLKDAKVLPEVIVYDPSLVAGLPVAASVASALNAMAHAVEGLYAEDRNPISSLLALEGLAAFAEALPAVARDPADLEARGKTLYGAWLCGTVLGQVGMALHHKLCHTLGGAYDLPHAETHAIVLAHSVAYNERAVPDLLAPVRALFGGGSAAAGLFDFAAGLGAPQALRSIGLEEAALEEAADFATRNPYWNPQPVDRAEIGALLARAWAGEPPRCAA